MMFFKVFSHKVNDRNAPIEPIIVHRPPEIVTAAPAEGRREEAYPTARTLEPREHQRGPNGAYGFEEGHEDDRGSTSSYVSSYIAYCPLCASVLLNVI